MLLTADPGLAIVHRFGQLVADGLPEGTGLPQTAEAGLPLVDRCRVSLIVRMGSGAAVERRYGELDVGEDLLAGCGWLMVQGR